MEARPMTVIQQILWELRMDYIGHPYYVSGNAILHALGQRLDPETHAALSASHGVFVPGQFGTFPEEHTQSGTAPVSRKRPAGRGRLRRPLPPTGRRCIRGC